jgi:hypothetical protein
MSVGPNNVAPHRCLLGHARGADHRETQGEGRGVRHPPDRSIVPLIKRFVALDGKTPTHSAHGAKGGTVRDRIDLQPRILSL